MWEITDATLATQSLGPEQDPIPSHVLQLSDHFGDVCCTYINGFPLPEQKCISQRRKTAKSPNNP